MKAWQVLEQPMPGMVVRPDPEYVFDKENPTEGGAQDQGQMRARRVRGAQAMGHARVHVTGLGWHKCVRTAWTA